MAGSGLEGQFQEIYTDVSYLRLAGWFSRQRGLRIKWSAGIVKAAPAQVLWSSQEIGLDWTEHKDIYLAMEMSMYVYPMISLLVWIILVTHTIQTTPLLVWVVRMPRRPIRPRLVVQSPIHTRLAQAPGYRGNCFFF